VSLSSDTELSRANDSAVVIDDFPYLSSAMMSKSCGPVDDAVASLLAHHHHHHHHLADMSRARSSNCIDGFRRDGVAPTTGVRGSPRFNELPDECRLHVFACLSILDRAIAAQVCSDWHRLMRDQSLWSNIDLTVFPACTHVTTTLIRHECSPVCYLGYRHRIKRFLRYLILIRPIVTRLKFALDIGEPADGYCELLTAFVKVSRWQDLRSADLTWTETPARGSTYTYPQLNVTWSSSELRDLVHRRRYRQRLFVRFFDLFTAAARNITELRVPFDWSERSISSLLRLTNLRVVTLTKYFRYSPVDPAAFLQVFSAMPELRWLTLELWTETGDGFALYSIQSKMLQYLDISSCRGVFLSKMQLPSLRTFRVSCNPLSVEFAESPFWQDRFAERPCVYDVIRDGGPRLEYLNDHKLSSDWSVCLYPELDHLLGTICSCHLHRPAQ
jgi:hypothetical protein